MKILLVDDEPMVVDFMKEFFTILKHDVVVAVDGLDGIIKFNENVDSIDMIVTDLRMPKVNGKTLAFHCKSIRHNLPVVIMSGYGLSHERVEFDRGFEYYIQKPIPLDELRSILSFCDANKQTPEEIRTDLINNLHRSDM